MKKRRRLFLEGIILSGILIISILGIITVNQIYDDYLKDDQNAEKAYEEDKSCREKLKNVANSAILEGQGIIYNNISVEVLYNVFVENNGEIVFCIQ